MALSVFADNAATAKVVEALKEHYKPQRIKEMSYKNNPLLATMPKYESFGGENMPIPLILTGPQRRSATFLTGQTNSSTSSVKQFLLTRARDYSFASIEHEAIKASQGNADAFVRYATMEIDGAVHSLKRSLAVAMYRDGSGQIGTINSSNPGDGATEFTLATPADIVNFEVGMGIVFAADTASALRAGGTETISAIDRSTGKITCTALHADVAAGDAVFQAGDYTAADDRLKIRGLEAWCPESATTLTASGTKTLFSVDRSTDTTRLGGNRFDGSSLPIEEALIEGASLVAREGGAPDHIFMDFASYSNLEKALGSKVQYNKVSSSDASVGFDALVVNGPRGHMNVIPDHNCQPNTAWMLQLDTWSMNSLGAAPQILDADGNNMLRENAADAYEVRVGYYGNVACNAPGWNCRVKLG
tara:strand:- start:2558 stop:3811 length:1254 start_codon:yes stop_codon:yes gene_type:complete